MADQANLHIALFPWLAFGHILPFLQFAISLAQRNHRISFISTPKNLQRLPKIPSNLSSLINLIPLPFPTIENLPPNAESTSDITTPDQGQYIYQAYDKLQEPLTEFLEESRPNWIIYDYAAYWLPPIAAKLHIPGIFFNIFNASMAAFYGSVSEMTREDGGSRLLPNDFLVPPKWIPFPSDLCLHPHEVPKRKRIASGESPVYRMGCAIQGCEFMAVRSCNEFEDEYLSFLENDLYKKPIIPIGLLPPPKIPTPIQENGREQNWLAIKDWLDKQSERSVVYIAFGSESALNHQQVTELAHSLEMSKLPFFWVVRQPIGVDDKASVFPPGFEDRVKNRAYVTLDWVPQLNILAHPSIGGFLSHSGWSSIVEGLAFGLTMILLPLSPPQALNARLLEGKKIGLEIPRDEQDGLFTSDSVEECLRTAMVGEEGEELRAKAQEMKMVFGDEERHDRYMDEFDEYLRKYKCE
ncbi:hypothetical protein ACHQM5_016336 [Ranunculus cassubicifolius]